MLGTITINMTNGDVWLNDDNNCLRRLDGVEFDEEQDVEGDQTTQSPDLGVEKVSGPQNLTVGIKENFPETIPLSQRLGINSVLFQDIPNSLMRNFMVQIF